MLGDEDADVERAIDMEAVATHWDELPEREQQILTMRFYGNLTQAEIGATPRHLPDARVPAALPRAGPPAQPPARRGRLTPADDPHSGRTTPMKTGAGLAFIAVGAILAFAVNGSPGCVNLHTVGWVLMLVGLVGMVLPRRTYGWLGRRMTVRRSYPNGRVEQQPVPPYVGLNPGTAREEAGLPPEPTPARAGRPDRRDPAQRRAVREPAPRRRRHRGDRGPLRAAVTALRCSRVRE